MTSTQRSESLTGNPVGSRYTNFVDENAEILGSLSPECEPYMDPRFLAEKMGMYFLQGTTRKGGRCVLIKWSEVSVEMLSNIDGKRHAETLYKQAIRMMMAMFGRMLSDPHAQVLGIAVCHDWAAPRPPMRLMMRLDSIMTIKQKRIVFGLFQDILPMRFTGLFALNQPSWFTVLLSLVKPFLSKKLRKRIYLLKDDYQRFHSLIDPAVLPLAFGGSQDWGPIRAAELADAQADGGSAPTPFAELAVSAAVGLSEGSPPPYGAAEAPCAVQ